MPRKKKEKPVLVPVKMYWKKVNVDGAILIGWGNLGDGGFKCLGVADNLPLARSHMNRFCCDNAEGMIFYYDEIEWQNLDTEIERQKRGVNLVWWHNWPIGKSHNDKRALAGLIETAAWRQFSTNAKRRATIAANKAAKAAQQ